MPIATLRSLGSYIIFLGILTVVCDSTCDKIACDGDAVFVLSAAQLLKKSSE